MRIRVDPDKCQGHARCYALAPELFAIDDYGLSTVVGDGTVPPGLEGRARLAIDNCPEFAVQEVGATGD
ncbi:MAG TPA: ferredoxin [Acidimicrobiales bacterium]|nr:ferredoxin [Acidimicrobiales bacterium]